MFSPDDPMRWFTKTFHPSAAEIKTENTNTDKRVELTDKLGQEDDKEGGDQVIDALNVAAGWVADGPNKEDTLKHLREKRHSFPIIDFTVT